MAEDRKGAVHRMVASKLRLLAAEADHLRVIAGELAGSGDLDDYLRRLGESLHGRANRVQVEGERLEVPRG